MEVNNWNNCYDEGWKDLIVPEAFSHPAKMSYGLLKRILDHAKGWLEKGDVILDPFGGIGSTGILGAYEGYQVVCVELEQKFVDLALLNFELHDNAWSKLGCTGPHILQGDSRRLCELVEKVDIILSSPPFGEQVKTPKNGLARKWCEQHGRNPEAPNMQGKYDGYGQTSGNLGNLKSGDVDCVISSPPFMLSDNRDADKSGFAYKFHGNQRYGNEKASLTSKRGGDRLSKEREAARQKNVKSIKNFGNIVSGGNSELLNIDTFWQAAKTIVEQCHQILKPGGHAIWVVKSFVRNKKIVDFPGDWRRLCESVGFETVCIHHAMLVKETSHKTLFGDTEVKRKERKSFFRRLAESKGSPRIDYEVVLCLEK